MTKTELNTIITTIKTLREAIDDKTASTIIECFSSMKYNGKTIVKNTRINFEGLLYQAKEDIIDLENNNPINNIILWDIPKYKNGYRIIPSSIASEEAFAKEECGWWNNELYESIIDNNAWNPEEYSIGWRIKEVIL
jgi:hypothetical protein